MKILAVLMLVVALSVANSAPGRSLGRVDGLLRAPITIPLEGSSASNQLTAICQLNSVRLTLAVTDSAGDLAESSIVVGDDANVETCVTKGLGTGENPLTIEVGHRDCGGVSEVQTGNTVYRWTIYVVSSPAAPEGISLEPLSSKHSVSCEVKIEDPLPATGNQNPGTVDGDAVVEISQAVRIRLEKLPGSSNRVWLFKIFPDGAVPTGLSYKLGTCTAKPSSAEEPLLTLIDDGCVRPRTGTTGTYAPATKEYELTVRAFAFTNVEDTIDIKCTAELCGPGEDDLCEGQSANLQVCGPAAPPESKSQVPNKLVRRARSVKQYVTSNIVSV